MFLRIALVLLMTSCLTLWSGVHPCCTPDDAPSCCMALGGFNTGTCAPTCGALPLPEDPGWQLTTEEHGCNVWTHPDGVINETPTVPRCAPDDAAAE